MGGRAGWSLMSSDFILIPILKFDLGLYHASCPGSENTVPSTVKSHYSTYSISKDAKLFNVFPSTKYHKIKVFPHDHSVYPYTLVLMVLVYGGYT